MGQLPSGWSDLDIGSPGVAGSAIYKSGYWTNSGGGADIWNTSDQFNFAYQNAVTNYSVLVARVISVQNTDPWAKAGVMFRDSTAANAMFAMVVATPGNGVNFQYRTATGGNCGYSQVAGMTTPIWVKLVRSGTDFSGYYSTDGAAWTGIGPSQTIAMGNIAPGGLAVTAHSNTVAATAVFSGVTATNAPPPVLPAAPTFGVYRQLWTGISGGLNTLTNSSLNPNWPNNPTAAYTKFYTNFEADVNTGMNNYGQRLRAFVVPPTNGLYTFWIASDDNSVLFLSTDETEANKTQIASVPGWTDYRQWNKYAPQQSAPVLLQSGTRYYLESVMQQGSGGDNLSVRWQLPDYSFEEPLPGRSATGTLLIPCTGVDTRPGIYQQVTNVTVVEGRNASLSVLATNQSAVTYQWSLNGANLAGSSAQKPVYTITNVSLSSNGQVYTCGVTNAAGGVLSSAITLNVLRDTVPPAVQRALNIGTNSAQIVYTKTVEAASATNTANYRFTNGLAVLSASLGADGTSVTLTTGPLVYGSNYTILISNVRDRASTPNTIVPNSPASFTALPYTPQDVGNPAIATVTSYVTNGLNMVAAGSNIGGFSDQFGLNYQPRTGDFDLAVRVAGMGLSDVWAEAGWMARETLDPGSRFAAALTTPAMVGSFFEWRDPAYSQASTSGNFPANLPNSWLRLKRAGNVFTGYASYDGVTWVPLGTATITMPAQLFVGLVVSSHNAGQTTTVQFRDATDVTGGIIGTMPNPHEPLGPCSRRTPIVISEIMYKPAPRTDTNNLEFVEVYNTNPYLEDMSGFRLAGGSVSYTFPAGTVLPGGAFLVVAAAPASVAGVYGITNVVGPYTGSLGKSGTIELLDDQGAILLTIPYSSDYPWPTGADGTGHSIILANPTYGEADPRAWDISDSVGGSPGQMDPFRPSPLRNVVINEFLAHTDPPDYDYIELYNHANTPVDISGCILSDDPVTNKFVIPAGTVIPARGFVWYSETNMNFRLSAFGDSIYFKNPDQSRVLDSFRFKGQENGVSMGRWPDGADEWYRLAAKTPGTNNGSIRLSDIVINELMYDPISGDNDDQYIELYNRSANAVDLGMWQLGEAVSFLFPSNTIVMPGGYLVIARNAAHLRTNYANLTLGNCLGDFTGKLSHKGKRLTLEMPHYDRFTNGTQVTSFISMHIVMNEVTYGSGGRWGQWSHGGGSSLELVDPNSNNRLAANWADSDETSKSVWTNLEYTGVLDLGNNYKGSPVDRVQVGLLDVGECLVDNIEVLPGGTSGANIVSGGDFEAGLGSWIMQGDHIRSGLETAGGLGGYLSNQSLHLRASDSFWTLGDYAQGTLTSTNLAAGQTATLRLKARWLHGWPEVLMRLRGNWLEVTGALPVPSNLGTPGLPNSRYRSPAGPAIYEVKHSPALPAANQPLLVTARFHDANAFQPTLLYRVDTGWNPSPSYTSVPMVDDGTGGDAIAGDGLYTATIPAQPAGTVVAFLVQATDAYASTIFPADQKDNAGVPRECVAAFGDPVPTASFSHHHVFISQNWAQLWAQNGGVSHEYFDGTWVDGGGRIVYNWSGRYAGSPYHQYTGSPITTLGGMHWVVPDDDRLFGTASLNKQHVPGNGPLDDNTLQREQTSYWMAHQIGLQRQNRRYYVFYVNGNRHGPLMEDSQVPGGDMLSEYFPSDTGGWLFKNHAWFEGDVAQSANGGMGFENKSWCTMGKYTTTVNGVPNQYKQARYRWMWNIRQYPASANDYSQVYALVDAANTPTSSPAYYANMESQVDTEEWLRWSAIEHATGDWDSFFTQNQWNMYNYKPTMGKWVALKWDWNITLGSSGSWGSDGAQLFNFGANDATMGTFHRYPAYFRAYLRALQDVANLAMNNSRVDPLLDSRYAAFVANGLTANSAYGVMVREPGAAGLKSWIGTMHNSILTALANQGVSSVAFAISSTMVSNDLAVVSGTAPLAVKNIWFNGMPYPVTWNSTVSWTVLVPLHAGTNQLSVVGVDLNNQPVPGATGTIAPVYNGTLPSPVGQVVINEIMYDAALPGAEYVELFNNSKTITFDLSGWQFKGLSYTFPAGSILSPQGYLLLTGDLAAFNTVYGGAIPVFDIYPGKLQNVEEMLSLIQTNGTNELVVSRVRYRGGAPWATGATGTGSSLQLLDSLQDNWRAGNWGVVGSNSLATPQWVYVTTNISATSSTLYLYLTTAGDIYLDDLKLVGSAGTNVLVNGDFESPLSGPWTVTPYFSGSTLSSVVRHGGNSSLHLVASAGGTGSGNSIYQNISPALVSGQTYTLSFWYLQSTNGGPLIVRLSSGLSYAAVVNPMPPSAGSASAQATPGAANSLVGRLAAFPPLWINEAQAENLTGATNSAGQRTPWLELYNPSTNTVSLNGIYLANNYTNLTQWAFPTTASINPGEFKLIFADARTNLSTLNELHTSFALPAGSGSLVLSRVTTNAQTQVLDFLEYNNLLPDYSYGSFPDGQSFYRQQFVHATPGATNDGTIVPSYIPYTAAGAVYSQDFNALPNPGTVSVNATNPVTINGVTYALPDPFDFALPSVSSGTNGGMAIAALAGWYGWSGVETKFGASAGDQKTGGQISFGQPANSNRALGLLATSSTGPTAFGVRFINQTTNTLIRFSLQFTGELWRQSDKAKTLAFYYAVDPSGTQPFSTNYLVPVPPLSVNFPPDPAALGGVAVDGTSPLNQTNLGVANLAITNWPPHGALWLVWEMADPGAQAQGLAIDNLSFAASAGNSPPALAPIPDQTVYANTLLSFTATATDSDYPSETLTFTLGPNAPAGAGISIGGVFSWVPTAAQAPGTYSLSVIVTDSGLPPLSATNSFNVFVYAPNTPPVLAPIADASVYANTLLSFTANATDSDQPAETLTFTLGPNSPAGAGITSGGVFSWTPTAAQAPGTYTISVVVADSGVPRMSATNSFNVAVYAPNTPPVLAPIGNKAVYANTLLSFSAGATDTDQPPQSLTFTLGPGAPTGASITANGLFTWTPTPNQAPNTNTLSVVVTDSGVPQLSATNSFTVVVYRPNTPPMLGVITNQTVYANTLLTFTASATDTDQPPQSLTFTLGPGAPNGASITTNGVFTWTPTPAQAPNTNTISVVVTDTGLPAMSATNSFNVVVYPPNTPPVLAALTNQTVHANTLLTFTASATDTDQPPQSLSFALGAGAPAGASITTNGVFTWTPTSAQAPSTNTISVTVTDSGLPPMSATNSFIATVLVSNQPPALVLESSVSINGTFAEETGAVFDSVQQTFTTATSTSTRFYRLRGPTATTIRSIRVQGTQVIIAYQ